MGRKCVLGFLLLLGFVAPLPAQRAPTDSQIRFYQWKVSKDPDYAINYDRLGLAYAQKARETGDTTFYALAETALNKSHDLIPPDISEAAGPLSHIAALDFSEHRFQESADLARQALGLDSTISSAYATLGDALSEMGEYEDAVTAYARLESPADSVTPRPGLDYLRESREANLNLIQGNSAEAIQHMKAAVQMAIRAGLPIENVAWTQFTLGEFYFESGDYQNAEQAYEASLATYPNYHRALAWLAQLRSAQGKYREAAALYAKAIAVIPLPNYVVALGDVYTKLGMPGEASKQYDLVEYIAKLSSLNERLYNRDLAVYYVDHNIKLKQSLEMLETELKVRHDVYTVDAYAWALERNGKHREAAEAMAGALRMNTASALFLFHAGMIAASNGDFVKSAEYLKQALATNPGFHIIYSSTAARTLRSLSAQSRLKHDGGTAELR